MSLRCNGTADFVFFVLDFYEQGFVSSSRGKFNDTSTHGPDHPRAISGCKQLQDHRLFVAHSTIEADPNVCGPIWILEASLESQVNSHHQTTEMMYGKTLFILQKERLCNKAVVF